MPDERVMAVGVNLAYDPDEDPTATAGEAQAWKHGREVGRAERAHEAAERAEAPDADEEALRGAIWEIVNDPTEARDEVIVTRLEALIAYRERRYREAIPVLRRAMGIIEHGAEMVGAEPYSFTKDEVIEESAKAIGIALRALSERSG